MSSRSHVLRVSLVTENQKFKEGMKGAESTLASVQAKFGALAAAAGAMLAHKAVGAVKDFAKDSIRAFSDLNESLNAVEVVFGKNAAGIKKLGEEAARSVGLSNAEFNSYAVSLANFAESIAGESGDVVAVVDSLSTRVADFASVMNLEVADAMGKFQSGLAGQSKPLREFGIDVSDANVKAYALANGIGEVGRELTEAEKVQARYGTIMEQTAKVQGDFANTSDSLANRERILAAELENKKALLGETIAPLKMVGQELQGALIDTLGKVSLSLGHMTGNLDAGTRALLTFRSTTGETAASVADAVAGVTEMWKDWSYELKIWEDNLFGGTNKVDDLTASVAALWGESDQSRESLNLFQGQLEDLWRAGEITNAQFVAMADTLRNEYTNTLEKNTAAAYENYRQTLLNKGATADLTDEVEDLAEAQKAGLAVLKDTNAELRAQIDPVFGLHRALGQLEDAQLAYNAAVTKFGAESPEAIAAARDLAGAYLDVDARAGEVVVGGQHLIDGFRNIASEAGIAASTVEATLTSALGRVPSTVTTRINVTAGSTPGGLAISPATGKISFYQHGGHMRAGEVGVVGEAGPEVWVPDTAGTVVPAGSGLGAASGPTYNVTVNALDPGAAARAVVEALQAYERLNGSVPVGVRLR